MEKLEFEDEESRVCAIEYAKETIAWSHRVFPERSIGTRYKDPAYYLASCFLAEVARNEEPAEEKIVTGL